MVEYLPPCPYQTCYEKGKETFCGYDRNTDNPCKSCGRSLYSFFSQCDCGFDKNLSPICQKCGIVYIAHVICNKCSFVWHSPVGPGNGCPKCGSVYGTWANYKEDKPNWCSICNSGFSMA